MYDPGMVYIFGFAVMLVAVAITLFFAKRALDKRADEVEKMSMTPIYACGAGAGVLIIGALLKLTVFADFYATHSIYVPKA